MRRHSSSRSTIGLPRGSRPPISKRQRRFSTLSVRRDQPGRIWEIKFRSHSAHFRTVQVPLWLGPGGPDGSPTAGIGALRKVILRSVASGFASEQPLLAPIKERGAVLGNERDT